jgi:thiamine-monophosphate kinase
MGLTAPWLEDVHELAKQMPWATEVVVNISDMAAMAAMPRWLTLSLTMPTSDEVWLQQFAAGLKDSLQAYDVMLIGGDTTRGPLNISMSILGIVANGMAVTRKGAKAGDRLYVTGQLGLAACALAGLTRVDLADDDRRCMLRKLHAPNPRVDLAKYLSAYASAAIDISDGLFQDLQHICAESMLGATIYADAVPIHPLLSHYMPDTAFNMAMTGGDDYELCLTVPQQHEQTFLAAIEAAEIICYPIGVMQSTPGVQVVAGNGMAMVGDFHGYRHF